MYRSKLDLRPNAPGQFLMEPAACQLHVWREGEGLIIHTHYLDRYPGPYSYGSVEETTCN
ncbi:MAG: hypothetical protein ACFB4I_15115 [Cyanophyceae cyanobacterium]